jgi:hypothetical protein
MSSEFVEERKRMLDVFLKTIATDSELIASPIVGDFIAKDSVVTLIDEKAFKQQQINRYKEQQQLLQQQQQQQMPQETTTALKDNE